MEMCPRCINRSVEVSEPETAGDPAVHDFVCTTVDCGYQWNWREGSEYAKPARAEKREQLEAEAAAADAPVEAETDVAGKLPTPSRFRAMTPAERAEKLPPQVASLTPSEYANMSPAEREALAAQ